jgi:tRNA (cmo5U34)-methyltransferase
MQIPDQWTFENGAVAEGFDRHVREQLPWYEMATSAVAHIARHYIPRGGLVYDIGAATGNVGRAIEATLDERHARFIPIESSDDMAKLYAGPQRGHLIIADAMEVEFEPFDLAIAFLTIMFMPVADRSAFVSKLVARCRLGGAVVIMDKTMAGTGYLATVLWRLTLAGKVAAGVDPRDIVAKELSLGGVQRPLDRDELGPGAVEWFRFGDFAGWVIEKGMRSA